MTPPDRPAVRVTDLRGKGSPPPAPVLADPSGRRATLLHRLGRFVGALLLLWFVCLVLAGLGLLPASGVPLAGELGPRTQPPSLEAIPAPEPTSAADLRPATPADKTAVDATDSGTADPTAPDKTETTTTTKTTSTVPVVTTPGKSGSAPGQTSTTAPGKSGSAPGQTSTTAPGKSGSAPGQTSTTAPGKSETAPGQTTTTHGNSDTAPGQAHTDTNPRGPGR